MHNAITDVPGIRVGHWTNLEAGTGCTVLLCTDGACAGIDVRGTAPGTRESDLLDPVCMVDRVHAILIGGGSAYGLAAADGVMQWLEEQGVGLDVGVAKVPIVPAAILFDLPLGRADVRPDRAAGYAACVAATDGAVTMGNAGAGTGATAGKGLGFDRVTKSGLGTASRTIGERIVVGAIVAANPFGEIRDPADNHVMAGPRLPAGGFADSMACLHAAFGGDAAGMAGRNTTLAIIATNALLDKAGATKVAQMAQDALARTIRPAHTHMDGDTVFALSYGSDLIGNQSVDLSLLGAVAAEALADAIVAAVRAAESLHGIPCARDLM